MFKLAFWILLCACIGCAKGQNNGVEKMDVFRLPKTTEPESYDLQFFPHFNGLNSTFNGVTKIVVSIVEPSNVITLNLKGLTVNNVTVTDLTKNKTKKVTDLVYQTKNEQFEIRLRDPLNKKNKYLVTILYEGKIRNDMTGLYMSSYEENNVTKWLAVTQYEPTYARRAFPCYDEPSYKAAFNISVVKRKDQIALSNMPIYKTENGLVDTDVVYFETTPLMSSYLTAIFVGEFIPHKSDKNITVYTHKYYINQTDYVATEAPKHLDIMASYTNIPYDLPKMDLLAIPDFQAGAMENWGMTTYREYYLLLHEESKAILKIKASEVIQHEFTHNWFGNLVTCSWWSHIWLNEAFAAYFQYFATGMVRTNWLMEQRFVVEAYQNALAYDQTPKNAMTSPVNTPEEIERKFDLITYRKGASVLRMLKHLITEKIFQSAINKYLTEMRELAAEPSDLFSSFVEAMEDEEFDLGLSVVEFMSNWTTQSGYPVLSITKNETSNTFSITQRRFFVNPDDAKNSSGSAWIVGLTYTTQSSKNFNNTRNSAWTNKNSYLTVIPAPRNSGWYIFNIKATGFYRVNYDIKNWIALIKQLKKSHTDIHVINRAQLIDDAFNLARAGQLNYSVPLHLCKYLKNETSPIPWYSAMNGFTYLLQHMSRSEKVYAKLKSHVSNLAGTIYLKLENLVSNGNTEYNVLSAWDKFSSWACKLNNTYCTAKATQYFKNWRAGKKIPADIKDAAFCVGVKTSTCPYNFRQMFKVYNTTKSISEKISARSALGCSKFRPLLTGYINHILDGPQGPIKESDFYSVISAISGTPLGLEVLYEFLSTNLNRILNELSNGEDIATYIYSTIVYKTSNETIINKASQLKDNSTVPESVRTSFQNSFENINRNLLWFNTHSHGINQWLIENQEPEPEYPVVTESPTTYSPMTDSPTTVSPVTTITPTSTEKPNNSSSSVNSQYSTFIILFTAFTLLLTYQKHLV